MYFSSMESLTVTFEMLFSLNFNLTLKNDKKKPLTII